MAPLKRILLINSSPRKKGNVDIVLDEISSFLGSTASVTKLYLNDLNFSPCQACEGCNTDTFCVLDDDLKKVYKEVIDSDVIIFGSPIYFGSISAQAKMFIDRMQPFWVYNCKTKKLNIKNKKGFLVLVGGSSKDAFFENARQIAKNFFTCINAKFCGELLFASVDALGSILDFPGLKNETAKLADAALAP